MPPIVRLFLVCLLAFALPDGPGPARAADVQMTAAEAKRKINLAGRQRMLSQRISLLLCMSERGIAPHANRAAAAKAINLFGATLAGLRHGDPDLGLPREYQPEVLASLDAVDAAWAEFSDVVGAMLAGGGEGLPALQTPNLVLLTRMNDSVGVMERSYGEGLVHPDLARVINLAGRQRMLIQRAAKSSCLAASGIAAAEERAETEATIALFEASHQQLVSGDPANGVIEPPDELIWDQLSVVEGLWQEARPLIDAMAGGAGISSKEEARLLTLTTQALNAMNDAVWMYENF